MDPVGNCETSSELLFFDTFSHESDQESNLDLVQFSSPIIIHEIRIIPLGARVEADFPGGVRLGATNPSAFDVNFYINDFTKPTLCTFTDLGRFEYKQNINIQYLPEERKPTDGLLIKGSYRTLTLAIFGVQTNVKDIITKEETPATTPVPDPSSARMPSTSDSGVPEEGYIFSDNNRAKDSIRPEELNPLLDRLAQSVLESQRVLRSNDQNDDESVASERTKDFPSIPERRQSDIDSTCVDRVEETFAPRLKRKGSSPSPSRIDSPRSLSPVRSPPSLKSPVSPKSDISMKSDNGPRSPDPKKRVSSRSPYSWRRTPTSTYSNHSSRSPKYIQSRSPSPWLRNQINSSQLSSPPSPLSPSYRKSHSPMKMISTTKTSIPGSAYNKERKRRSRSSSPFSNEIEADHNSQTLPILPVNTDLLEEISPEQSLSDWAENISEDENLDGIESGVDGEGDTFHQECQESEPFESISSEEEYFEEANLEDSDRLSHYSDYDLNDYIYNYTFDPYHCDFTSLQYLRDPSETNYSSMKSSKHMVDMEKSSAVLSQLKEKDDRSYKWVESMENITKDIDFLPLDQSGTLQTILDWLIDGLNFDLAIKQAPIPYKVRQLKSGIKLSIALSDKSDEIAKKLLDLEIPRLLMDLYLKPNMSLPLKLLIIRAFDALSDSVVGIEHILSSRYNFEKSENGESNSTCYQKMLLLLLSKPSSRIAIALEALFNKINFYELLVSFKDFVENSQTDIYKLSACIRKIGSCFASAKKIFTQKVRCLPVTRFFEIKDPQCDCYFAIYNWFKYHQFIDNMIKLLKGPHQEQLASDIHHLMEILSSEESFPRFLLGRTIHSKTNELIPLLLHNFGDNQNYYAGVRLSSMLQAYQLVDLLFTIITNESFNIKTSFDDPEVCSLFNRLHSLIFTSTGRECVVHCLASSNNFKAFLPFLTPTGDEEIDAKLFKSVCSAYAAEFCLLMVQLCDEDVRNILTTYGQTLLSISKNSQLPKLSSIANWITPLETMQKFDYSENTFKELMAIVKNHAETANKLKENEIFKLSPQLITVMRILQKLCVHKSFNIDNKLGNEPVEELKYYYATIQVFSHDGLSTILILLQKLAETYLRPSHQSSTLVGEQGSFLMGFVKPAVLIVKEMLKRLIAARGKDFRDISPIPVMLKLYSLMYIFPRSSFSYSTSREVIREIVDILMLYTQLCLTPSESDHEALSKGVWTKMINEVLQYTFSLPMTFIHGLSLLSELLPLPLPFQTLTSLSEEEINRLINIRKLWSAHLLGLSADLEKLITNFVLCSSPIIQQLLRRVCVQISDLSSPASTMMVRSVLEVLLDSLPNDKNEKPTSSLIYVLNLLSYLSSHPPFKMAFIHTMHLGGKLDEKYFAVVGKLLKLLREDASKQKDLQINHLIFAFLQSLCDSDIYLNSRCSPVPSLQILSNSLPPKESLKLIISTLLRYLSSKLSSSSPASASLPSAKSNSSLNTINSILPVLRILSPLCDHDYGYIPLKQGILQEAPSAIYLILVKISEAIKSEQKTADLNRAICTVLDFVKAFIFENEKRTCTLTFSEISSLLNWKSEENGSGDKSSTTTSQDNRVKEETSSNSSVKDGESECKEPSKEINEASKDVNNGHPILLLNQYLKEDIMDENVISCMPRIAKTLLDLLSSPSDEPSSEIPNIDLPNIEPLPLQFSKREVFIITNNIDPEKLNPNFWLSVPTFDDHEANQVVEDGNRISFKELCEKYLQNDFNLRKALEELCKSQEPSEVTSSNKPEGSVHQIRRLEPFLPSRDSKSFATVKKSFVAPLRGRGFVRPGAMMHSSRANDPFRSRPPNTSRPPSMHVDDFVALEQSGTNCNNYEQPNKRLKVDYGLKQRTGPIHNSSSRSFGASSTTVPSRSSPSYHTESYSNRRNLTTVQHSHQHQSPSRNNLPNNSNRNSITRYSRDSYSPPVARPIRSGSLGPPSSLQHRTKSNSTSRRDSRDSRESRDSRQVRQSVNR